MTVDLPVPGALSGVKVLDLSRWIAGPFATMLMADAGADVIKVEGLGGEEARHAVPRLHGTSAYVHHYNRNKRGLSVDLRNPKGQAIIKTLATEWADVLVENFRPGILEKIGLDYASLKLENPGLVMTSVTGFGGSGPDSSRPGFNTIAEAFAGAMSLTGDADSPPTMSGFYAADHTTGLYAAFGTMLALTEKAKTGRGQLVDLALSNSMLSVLGFKLTARMNNLEVSSRTGNRDSGTAPADLFWTKDNRPVYIDAGTDVLFLSLSKVMGDEALVNDPKFSTNEARILNWKGLYERISAWAIQTLWEDLQAFLEDAGIPYAAVNTVDEAIREPQFAVQEMVTSLELEGGEKIYLPGMALKLSETPGCIRTAAPMIGQHSVEILNELCGMSEAEIKQLEQDGAVRTYR